MPFLYMLTGIDRHWPAYIRHATTSHWSVRFKPSRWQHLRVLGPLAKDLSKESSKEITTTDSLEPSLDNSLAKVPRMLRCCHLDGLNPTDQHKVDASLIYADRHWPASTGINQHQPASTGIDRHRLASTGINWHRPAYIRHATASHWSVRFKPWRW